jgi:hypothetical protein
MATKPIPDPVIGQGNITVLTPRDPATGVALNVARVTAFVEEEYRLVARVEIIFEVLE